MYLTFPFIIITVIIIMIILVIKVKVLSHMRTGKLRLLYITPEFIVNNSR